jgi:hypothetical protein
MVVKNVLWLRTQPHHRSMTYWQYNIGKLEVFCLEAKPVDLLMSSLVIYNDITTEKRLPQSWHMIRVGLFKSLSPIRRLSQWTNIDTKWFSDNGFENACWVGPGYPDLGGSGLMCVRASVGVLSGRSSLLTRWPSPHSSLMDSGSILWEY